MGRVIAFPATFPMIPYFSHWQKRHNAKRQMSILPIEEAPNTLGIKLVRPLACNLGGAHHSNLRREQSHHGPHGNNITTEIWIFLSNGHGIEH